MKTEEKSNLTGHIFSETEPNEFHLECCSVERHRRERKPPDCCIKGFPYKKKKKSWPSSLARHLVMAINHPSYTIVGLHCHWEFEDTLRLCTVFLQLPGPLLPVVCRILHPQVGCLGPTWLDATNPHHPIPSCLTVLIFVLDGHLHILLVLIIKPSLSILPVLIVKPLSALYVY